MKIKFTLNPKIKLIVNICGGGDRIYEIGNKIDSYGLSDVINYYDRIPYKDMPEFIQKCDLIFVPSIEESFGVVAIESMACCVPCITSNAPGLAEVMINGCTGYVVEENDINEYVKAFYDLINDPQKIKTFGDNARKHVEQYYDFEANIMTFVDGFQSLVYKKQGSNI